MFLAMHGLKAMQRFPPTQGAESMDILIKGIPEELVAKIDKVAGQERRSRVQEIIVLLEYAVKKSNGKR